MKVAFITGVVLLIGMTGSSATASISPRNMERYLTRTDPCLAAIVRVEDHNYSPYAGRVSGSYGMPQADPGSKMEVAGVDWQTNLWTQLRWMRWYVGEKFKTGVTRYSGCWDALAHEREFDWY